MARRPAEFDLRAALREPWFTPRAADAPALLALLDGDQADDRVAAGRALGRLLSAAPLILSRAEEAPPRLRCRLTAVVGQLAAREAPGARALLVRLLSDADHRTRRSAAMALGRLPGQDTEDALLEACKHETEPTVQRALVAALGKIGGPRSQALLAGLQTDDPILRRIVDRALLMVTRTVERPTPACLRLDRAPPRPLTVLARCRGGLEEVLADELAPLAQVLSSGPGEVRILLGRPPADLLRARTLLTIGFPLEIADATDRAAAIAQALLAPAAREILYTFTDGPIRFRLAWCEGGHRRAETWRCAKLVAEADARLRNDPTGSLWEVRVRERGGLRLEVGPLRPVDDRFFYRKQTVPAASHPTVAAALARMAGVDPQDVVWDPFVGSGLELAERALLGPYAALLGSDISPAAIEAARANLTAVGARFELSVRDACAQEPWMPNPTLILTNPPMGRRVHRGGGLGELLDRFIGRAGRVLRPGGRLVWLSPLPSRTAARLRAAGLVLERTHLVDMGGFQAQLQLARKPAAPSGR
ncbi:MAG: HEAT repeat domain-containing protein [Myxococcales bacterium]|nr:HEAT repeat domain-containing protein [Myxococcota bacterium]MDW8282399.1 HEAT repeat domain-containing protein [Myxococcales bacterium]